MTDLATIRIHDHLAAGRLHQARDAVCRLLADIEHAIACGDATDSCPQARQGEKCVHVSLEAKAALAKVEDVWE